MATTEDEIRKGVSLLLEQYGTLTTSEVKQLLGTVMLFDEDDEQEMSNSRNEPSIKQRIGNIVSHQKEKVQTYFDFYQIDKRDGIAKWSILTGLNTQGTLRPINDEELQEKQNIKSRFSTRKIDWSSLNDSRDIIGQAGEEFALRYETNRVLQFAMDDTNRIIHLSLAQGDGAGFDILSLNNNGSVRYIEVKTTKSNLDTPFYMTQNEKLFFELHKDQDDLYIYRVYNFDPENNQGSIEVISAKDLLSNYNFDAVTYKVSKKLILK
ncbi:DUF3883 domain-containing protein [Weissella sp. MSCH1]|uniref:DUF3883 domain-containing protein n=1 Tax=Weissella sp. MSCH1 TaxID=3383343 RepID=UPI0038968CA2